MGAINVRWGFRGGKTERKLRISGKEELEGWTTFGRLKCGSEGKNVECG